MEAPYPAEAEAAGIEGTVRLRIEIDEAGEVTHVAVIAPAGHGFDEAAVAAAWQFRFEPAQDASGPVAVAVEFDYGFALDARPAPDAAPAAELPVNVAGQVVQMGTKRPLPGAAVQLLAPDGALVQQATADDAGRYAFRGVPPGSFTLRARAAGHADASEPVEVRAGEVLSVRLWARDLDRRDDEIVGVYEREEEDVTRRTLSMAEVRRVPGAFGDPVRIIQSLPGAGKSGYGRGELILRGAEPGDSAAYIDGIRVQRLYHMESYTTVLNADLIDAVDYLPGSYSVRYGRTLGGAVDVTTTQEIPEQARLSWSTDVIDSGGLFAGRIGGTGVAVAARRSYLDAALGPYFASQGATVLPRWYDYQLKVAPPGGASLLLFGSRDRLILSLPPGVYADYVGEYDGLETSHRALARWEADLGEDLGLDVRASLGAERFRYAEDGGPAVQEDGVVLALRAEAPWQAREGLRLTPGLDLESTRYRLSGEEKSEFDETGWITTPDLFLDAQWRPLEDHRALLVNPGIRLGTALRPGYARSALDPRLGARWAAGERLALKGGTGIYHQPPQSEDFELALDPASLRFERAWSSEIGAEYDIAAGLSADLTLFHREVADRIVDPYSDGSPTSYTYTGGAGRVDGLEVMLRQAPVGNFFGWISLTLSRSLLNDAPEDGGAWYPFYYDQPYNLVAVAGYDLPRAWGVSGRLQYVSGDPYTPIDRALYSIDNGSYYHLYSEEVNSGRMLPYFAVDLRVDRRFTFQRWELETYLELIHALRGENPEYINYNADASESYWIYGLPSFPSPGFNANFYF